ncbi:putative nuclease HARBI1 [Lucilia cuprina]|nr:putative nuclease HARBI1 [Lucilia cuprina]
MFNTIQDMFDSSESSSSDDEIVEMCVETDEEIQMLSALIKDKRNSIKDYMETVFPIYSESEFKMHFRISRSLFDALCSKFEESAIFLNLRKDKRLSAREHLAVFLWFAGHEGTSFRDLSDRFNISTSTVRYPGSSHDSWIYQNSPIFNRINSYCGDYYLLGDSAYPCSKHLVTPYRDNGHLTNIQKTFNIKLSSARVSIEHTFGILKQRFRQLYYCKLKGVKKLCHFIRACCVLHNIASENDLDFIYENSETNSHEVVILPQEEHITGNAFRQLICSEIQKNSNKFCIVKNFNIHVYVFFL